MQTDKKSRDKLWELQGVMTKMPLTVCCSTVLPEFGLRWKEVSQVVRNCRLPMQSSSVARVLCQYLAKSLAHDELHEIITRLRLKLVAIQPRTWHVLHLHEPLTDEPISELLETLPWRVLTALQQSNKGVMRPEVHSLMSGDLLYLSVQFVSDVKQSPVLYVATPPGQPVAQISALVGDRLVKACVNGLGYSSYTRADLHGSHVPSLLRVARGAGGAAGPAAPYRPAPAHTSNGIDYTHTGYDLQYVDSIIGPDPPLLTELTIKTTSSFFDPASLNKSISLTLQLRSDDVAATLRAWVAKRAIAPDSRLLTLIHKTRANRIVYDKDGEDDKDGADSE